MRIRLLLLFILFLFGTYHVAFSCESDLYAVSMQEKLDSSEVIVRGEVIQMHSQWNAAGTMIYTYNMVHVDALFKGTLSTDTIIVVSLGGKVGNIIHSTSSLVKYTIGDYGIFFTRSFGSGLHDTYASQQGFLKYDDNHAYASCPFYAENVQVLEVDLASSFGAIINYTIPNFGFNTFASQGNTVSFYPPVITAGTGDTLKVIGSGFGTSGPNLSEFVSFPDANSGGVPIYYEPPLANYLTWTDSLIEVVVPTRAGTGPIKVEANSIVMNSVDSLIIPFAILNANDEKIAYLHDDNGTGGRTWTMNVSLFGAAGETWFASAMDTWKCATGINWEISGNSSFVGAVASDGIDLVFYGPLSAGVLGVCNTFSSSCNGVDYYVSEQDIVFSSTTNWYYGNGNVPTNQFDFTSVALHELGHAHLLGHVMDQDDIMYFSTTIGSANQGLEPYNVIAGNYVMDYATTNAVCGTQAHNQNFQTGCSHPVVTDVWLFESSDLPNDSTCIGLTPISIDFGNLGADPVTDIVFNWSMNGILQPNVNWTGSLLSGQNIQDFPVGSFNVQDSTYTCEIWVSNVNGVQNYLTTNDTLKIEFTPVSCTPDDAAIRTLNEFDSLACYTNEDIIVTLINEGENNLTSCWIHFEDAIGTEDSIFWSGNLSPGDSVTPLTVLNYGQFQANNEFTVWVEDPNGVPDTYNANDTSEVVFPLYRLNGTYTIGGINPDYATPQDAFLSLSTYGTCGNVVLNIRPGIYQWEFELENIDNYASTDSVLIQSETQTAQDVVLKYPINPFISNALVSIINSKNITFKHLTLDRNNTQAGTVPNFWIGIGAENIKIDSCIFQNSQLSQYVDNVYIQSARYDSTVVKNISIKNNRFQNGSRGVHSEAYLMNTLDGQGISIISNHFDSIVREDIVLLDFDSIEIAYNYSNHIGSFLNVPSVLDIEHLANDSLLIHHNTMLGYGNGNLVRITSPNNTGNQPLVFYNNSLSQIERSNANSATVDLINVNEAQILFNSFYSEQAENQVTTVSKIIYSEVQDSLLLYNNQFVFNGTGYFFQLDNAVGLNSDHNNFYNEGSIFVRNQGTILSDFLAYKTATNQDANSTFFDPVFISDSLLLPTVTDLIDNNGIPLGGITDDIVLNLRDVISPDMGSHEFEKPLIDLVMLPSSNLSGTSICQDAQEDLYVEMSNYGSDPIDSFEVYVSINGSTIDTVSVQTLINSFDTVNVFIGNYAVLGVNPVISLNSNMPNGIEDSLYQNNDFEFTLSTKLAGVYTVGGTSADFTTIQDALTNLHVGICDTVWFNINPGFYNNWGDLGPIPGNTSTTAIYFQSAIPDTGNVIVSSGSLSGKLDFHGVYNVYFKHLNFEKNNTSNSPDLSLFEATNLSFDSCYFGPESEFETENSFVPGADGLSFKSCTFKTTRIDVDHCDNFLLQDCKFTGDYGFVRHFSSENLEFINNHFDVSQQYFNSAIDISWSAGPVLISENTIKSTHNGLNLVQISGETIAKNNFIVTEKSPIWTSDCADIKIYNNSFLAGENGLQLENTVGLDFQNNIVKLEDSSYHYFFGQSVNNLGNVSSNYNLFHGGSILDFASIDGANYSFASWQSTTANDNNSIFGDPQFFSNTDLHTNAAIIDSAGVPLPSVTDDIDAEIRDLNFPDIGADEFDFDSTLFYDIAIDSLLAPDGLLCVLQDSVVILVQNNLDTSLTSFTYEWSVNSGTPITGVWTGSIASGGADEINLGTFPFLSGETYSIFVNIDFPNGLTDFDAANNTVLFTYYGYEEVQIQGDSVLCVYDSLLLQSSVSSNDQQLNWSNSSVTDSIFVTAAGQVTLTATDFHGCISVDTLNISLLPTPVPAEILGDTIICPGTGVDLTASPILSGNNYDWSITIQNISQVTATSPGTVTLVIINQDGCISEDSHTLIASVTNSSFTVVDDTVLQSDFIGSGYQWYFDFNPIVGATQDSYVITQSGFYALLTTNFDGCDEMSTVEYVDIDNLSLEQHEIQLFTLYPNPSSGKLNVKLPDGMPRNVEILDVHGKKLLDANTKNKSVSLDIGHLSPGVYFVNVSGLGCSKIVVH